MGKYCTETWTHCMMDSSQLIVEWIMWIAALLVEIMFNSYKELIVRRNSVVTAKWAKKLVTHIWNSWDNKVKLTTNPSSIGPFSILIIFLVNKSNSKGFYWFLSWSVAKIDNDILISIDQCQFCWWHSISRSLNHIFLKLY